MNAIKYKKSVALRVRGVWGVWRGGSLYCLCCLPASTPVQAALEVGGGGSFGSIVVVDSHTKWTMLVGAQIDPGHARCVATGSSDVLRPPGVFVGRDQYRFRLCLDNANSSDPCNDNGTTIDHPGERTVEFLSIELGAVGENSTKEVTSTWSFFVTPDDPDQTAVFWVARKFKENTSNLTVNDSSITFVCN